MSESCSATIQGLEGRYPRDVLTCGEAIPVGMTAHTGIHVTSLRDGRTGWWYGTLRGVVLRSGELIESGGGSGHGGG